MGDNVTSLPTNAADTATATAKTPHSVAAEQALLGAIMLNNKSYDDLQGRLLPDHFYVTLHAEVFKGCEVLINRGREANPLTIRETLKNTPFNEETDLFDLMTRMVENASYSEDINSLADIIHTTYMQRTLMSLGQDVTHKAPTMAHSEETIQLIDQMSGELFQLAETGHSSTTIQNLRNPLLSVLEQAEKAKLSDSHIIGLTSGFVDLDKMLGGLQNSDLIILAARPSMGKTAFALNVATNVAQAKAAGNVHGGGVGIFSLEMSSEQLAMRVLSSTCNINSNKLSTGHLSDNEYKTLVTRMQGLAELPLYIDDTPQLSINAVRSRARRMKRQFDVNLIIVDYLQLMRGSGNSRDMNRVQEISEISQGLKHIARELNVPVIALSQLSRAVESRDNKRPQLSDLRESGSIEQDADIVMFLYREDYYLKQQLGSGDTAGDEKAAKLQERLQQSQGKTEVLINKNRKGSTGTVTMLFHGETTTFHSLDQNH